MWIAAAINRFSKDEEGTAAILWAISLVAVLGFVAVGWEVGKMGRTHAELQSFVDAVALAAAGELDGRPDSITRATAAANNLIRDTNTYGVGTDGNRALGSADFMPLIFLSGLPASDTASVSSFITTTPAEAELVEVTAQPHTITITFLRVLNGLLGQPLGNNPRMGAKAIAGYAQAACDITPLMFCLPSHDLALGDMIELRAKGGSGQWSSGNFGFLDLFADGTGICGVTGPGGVQGSDTHCLLSAQEGISQCALTNGTVDIDPGQSAGPALAINNRFDLFENATKHFATLANFAAAPNVIKGQTYGNGQACNAQQMSNNEPTTIRLNRDTCLGSPASCNVSRGITDPRFGDGTWDRTTYLSTNHNTDWATFSAAYAPAVPVNPLLTGSRYDVYLREITKGGGVGVSTAIISDPALLENGRAQCSPTSMATNVHRRTLVVAGISCGPTDPINSGSGKKNIPVDEYYEVFLTEPVVDTPEFGIFGEIIGVPTNNGSGNAGPVGIFRDVVQLYR